MPNDVDSRRRELIKQIDSRLELLALRLEVHGPDGVSIAAVRELRDKALEVRNLLRSHGFTEAEIGQLLAFHPTGCPCWECIVALHKAVRNHRHKLDKRYNGR